jgi:Uma2 family endonuclease
MAHEELDSLPGGATLDAESDVPLEEDRAGCEMIDGRWAPKHPAEAPADADRPGCELIDGVWVEKGMSNLAGLVESNLNSSINRHVRANRLGFVFAESATYQLFADQPNRLRRPDLSFVRLGRLPGDKVPDRRMQLAPDLAVEVISPTDLAEGVESKLDEYLRAGVRLVWVLYLTTKNVWAYKPDGTASLYRPGDALPGGEVIPGFSVPVGELFEGV